MKSIFSSIGNFYYKPGFDLLTIDTGNETRTPSIIVTDNGGNALNTYHGCSTSHEYRCNGSRWNYQVARFTFESNVIIGSHIRIIGANALSLAGANISVETNGKLSIDSNGMLPTYREPRFVGGFVARRGVYG